VPGKLLTHKSRGRDADGQRRRAGVARRRGDGDQGRGTASSGLRRSSREERTARCSNRSAALSRSRRDSGAGRAIRDARPEHHREDSGDIGRSCRHRRSHGAGDLDQRNGVVFAGPGGCRGRRGRARPRAAGARRIRRVGDGAGVHDHGGPPRRLAQDPGQKHNLSLDRGVLEWAGVAVFKKAYRFYLERGYRTRLLSAAFRNHMHWSEFIGGDVVISPPHTWQVRFNASAVPIKSRIDRPVATATLASLLTLEDFRRAYDEGGLTPRQFDDCGPTVRRLRQFSTAWQRA
jgi:hypothetical protein